MFYDLREHSQIKSMQTADIFRKEKSNAACQMSMVLCKSQNAPPGCARRSYLWGDVNSSITSLGALTRHK